MPFLVNPCQSLPIRANPCQSVANRGSSFRSAKSPISANMCQSKVNVSAKHTFSNPAPIQAQLFNNFQRPIHTNHGQFIAYPTPTQSHSADAVPIWASSHPPIQRPSCTASLSVQVMQHQPRTYTNASKLKVDWHSNDKGFPNPGQSGANFMPFTRTFVWITKEQVFYTGWSLVYSEDKIQAT